MMNGTPGLSALADAVEKLNAGIDSMGNRMDAMVPKRTQFQQEMATREIKKRLLAEKERKEKKAKGGGAKADATKEVHEFYASHAKKTAQKAIDGGDPKLAAKWVDYGTSHTQQAKDKTEKMEGPPEDKKKADKKK